MSKYNIVDRAKFTFYQILKLLIHGEKYKNKLTHSEIIAYSILMDRLNVSIKNNWFDEDGDIYFVYSNEDLLEILHVSKMTLSRIKKSLQDIGLLKQERTGRSNRLYLLEPETETISEAAYIMELDHPIGTDQSRYTKQDKETLRLNLSKKKTSSTHEVSKVDFVAEKLSDQRFLKNDLSTKYQKDTPEVSKVDTSKNNLIRTKDSKDSKESEKTDQLDTDLISNAFKPKEENQETEKQVIHDYIKERDLEFLYGTQLIQKMGTFSFNDFDTFLTFMNKLEFSHQSVEKQYEMSIPIHEGSEYFTYTQECLLSTFNRAIQQYRFGKVKNIASYLFVSFKQVFTDLADGMNATKKKEESTADLFNVHLNVFNSTEN